MDADHQLVLSMPEDVWSALRVKAMEADMSISAWILGGLEQQLGLTGVTFHTSDGQVWIDTQRLDRVKQIRLTRGMIPAMKCVREHAHMVSDRALVPLRAAKEIVEHL